MRQNLGVLVAVAARRWKDTWETAWPRRDWEAVARLYAPHARYRALAFREASLGTEGVVEYLRANFEAESEVTCRFNEPLATSERAAVEWWASWVEDGERLSMAGVTLLRFEATGLVIDHRDYWNQLPGGCAPYPDW